MFVEMYNLYKQKKADDVDLFGSEAKQFFQVIQGTKVGKIETYFNCNNPEWNKSLKNWLDYIKTTQNRNFIRRETDLTCLEKL